MVTKCSYCNDDFLEPQLECSHDIPRYIGGTDLDGRHWLCKQHHKKYERKVLISCLKIVGETLEEGEEISWMKDLSKQSEQLKIKFREEAKKVKEEFYKDGDSKEAKG